MSPPPREPRPALNYHLRTREHHPTHEESDVLRRARASLRVAASTRDVAAIRRSAAALAALGFSAFERADFDACGDD